MTWNNSGLCSEFQKRLFLLSFEFNRKMVQGFFFAWNMLDKSWNRCLAMHLNSGNLTESREILTLGYKLCICEVLWLHYGVSVLYPQCKCGIPTTGSLWDKWYWQKAIFHEENMLINSYVSIKAAKNFWPIRHFRGDTAEVSDSKSLWVIEGDSVTASPF